MKPKQLTLIVLLAVVLGGMGLWIARRDAASYVTSGPGLGDKVLPEFPLNQVVTVTINDGTNTLQLAKAEEIWKVQQRYGYRADFADLGDFIRKVWELKAVQSESVGESGLKKLQLMEPAEGASNAGTAVTFQGQDGKTIAKLILGKQKMRESEGPSQFGDMGGYPEGRWVRVVDGPAVACLVSEPFSTIQTKADQWIDKEFFKVEKLKRVEVAHSEPTNSWTIYRETEGGELKLADLQEHETLDTGKASPVGNLLSWPSFVDIASPDESAETTGLDHPVAAQLETFEGFTYTVTVGGKTATNDYRYLQMSVKGDFPKEREAPEDETPEDKERLDKEFKEETEKLEAKLTKEKGFEGWTYIVSSYTVDNLLKNRSDFLKEPEPEAEQGADAGSPDAANLGPVIDTSEPPPLPPSLDIQ